MHREIFDLGGRIKGCVGETLQHGFHQAAAMASLLMSGRHDDPTELQRRSTPELQSVRLAEDFLLIARVRLFHRRSADHSPIVRIDQKSEDVRLGDTLSKPLLTHLTLKDDRPAKGVDFLGRALGRFFEEKELLH